MNSLEDISSAVAHMIQVILAARCVGLSIVEMGTTKGTQTISIELADYNRLSLRLSYDGRLELNMSNFCEIARHFDLFYAVAKESAVYLEKNLETFKKDKSILAPFILQEKITR
jgi:hypothetical protein